MSEYSPGDLVKLIPGVTTGSRNYKYAKLKARTIEALRRTEVGNTEYGWQTYNKKCYGVWESEIDCIVTKEEYEKGKLMEELV